MKYTALLIGTSMVLLVLSILVSAQSYNYEYVNTTARVNITNAIPEILQVLIEDPVVLNAGGFKSVWCNATIRDWNGFNDIDLVNATLYYFENASVPDDNDVHYTNTSCVELSNDGQYIANYTCTFSVAYHANQGDWVCNVTVQDDGGLQSSLDNQTTFDALLALNVTDLIDYGNLSVGDFSLEIPAIVTNFGNTDINVSVLGYGETEGDGVGLVCDLGTNISVEYQRWSNVTALWEDRVNLSATLNDMGFTLDKPTTSTIPVNRTTYWQLFVPPNPFGICEGTIRFTAMAP